MEYDNTNRGALFKNDKEGNDKRPDYRGNALIECPCCRAKSDMKVSSWLREKRDGSGKFLSMSYEPKDQPPQPPQPRQSPAPTAHQVAKQDAYQPQDDEDDIPF
jgi:hypothetical protein